MRLDEIGLASRYRQDGFALVEDLFSPSEIATVSAAVDALEQRARTSPTPEFSFERSSPGVLRRTFRPLDLDERLAFLHDHPPLLDAVAECIGPDIEFQGSKIVWKPPRSLQTAQWHQDLAFFHHTNSSLVTISLHLDDFRDGQGALRFAPGSHRRGILPHVDGTIAGEDLARCEAQARQGGVGPGGLTLHHSLTAHAARTNDTDRMRRRLLLVYRAADCASLEDPLLEVYGSQSGRRVRGTAPLAPRTEPLRYESVK